ISTALRFFLWTDFFGLLCLTTFRSCRLADLGIRGLAGLRFVFLAFAFLPRATLRLWSGPCFGIFLQLLLEYVLRKRLNALGVLRPRFGINQLLETRAFTNENLVAAPLLFVIGVILPGTRFTCVWQ